jgi:hypothetical protein
MTRGEFAEFVRLAGMGVVATVDAEGNPEAGSFLVAEGSWPGSWD